MYHGSNGLVKAQISLVVGPFEIHPHLHPRVAVALWQHGEKETCKEGGMKGIDWH
jgi:hypothetical protein